MLKFLTVALIFILYVKTSFGTERINNVQYTREFDTLADIAKRYFPRVKDRYNNKIVDYAKDLIKWNKHILNWKALTRSKVIYIDKPDESEREFDGLTRDWSFYVLYMASLGRFIQDGEVTSLTTWQNSPISIGLGSYYNIKNRIHSMVSNVYISKLSSSKAKGEVQNADQDLPIPLEIGVNLYYQYTFRYDYPTLYMGFDKEAFTTFNLRGLSQGDTLTSIDNHLYFGTIGLTKSYSVYDVPITLRLSYAKSLISKNSTEFVENSYEGNRILAFISIKGKHNLSYNLLYKHMSLTGESKLSVDRIGIGMGWQFY